MSPNLKHLWLAEQCLDVLWFVSHCRRNYAALIALFLFLIFFFFFFSIGCFLLLWNFRSPPMCFSDLQSITETQQGEEIEGIPTGLEISSQFLNVSLEMVIGKAGAQ